MDKFIIFLAILLVSGPVTTDALPISSKVAVLKAVFKDTLECVQPAGCIVAGDVCGEPCCCWVYAVSLGDCIDPAWGIC